MSGVLLFTGVAPVLMRGNERERMFGKAGAGALMRFRGPFQILTLQPRDHGQSPNAPSFVRLFHIPNRSNHGAWKFRPFRIPTI